MHPPYTPATEAALSPVKIYRYPHLCTIFRLFVHHNLANFLVLLPLSIYNWQSRSLLHLQCRRASEWFKWLFVSPFSSFAQHEGFPTRIATEFLKLYSLYSVLKELSLKKRLFPFWSNFWEVAVGATVFSLMGGTPCTSCIDKGT